jgi:hypothetical protein
VLASGERRARSSRIIRRETLCTRVVLRLARAPAGKHDLRFDGLWRSSWGRAAPPGRLPQPSRRARALGGRECARGALLGCGNLSAVRGTVLRLFFVGFFSTLAQEDPALERIVLVVTHF